MRDAIRERPPDEGRNQIEATKGNQRLSSSASELTLRIAIREAIT
jgi:hypothetical protein